MTSYQKLGQINHTFVYYKLTWNGFFCLHNSTAASQIMHTIVTKSKLYHGASSFPVFVRAYQKLAHYNVHTPTSTQILKNHKENYCHKHPIIYQTKAHDSLYTMPPKQPYLEL